MGSCAASQETGCFDRQRDLKRRSPTCPSQVDARAANSGSVGRVAQRESTPFTRVGTG